MKKQTQGHEEGEGRNKRKVNGLILHKNLLINPRFDAQVLQLLNATDFLHSFRKCILNR